MIAKQRHAAQDNISVIDQLVIDKGLMLDFGVGVHANQVLEHL